MTKQSGLPGDIDHVYGRPSNYKLGGNPDLAIKGGKPGGSDNMEGKATKYVSTTVSVTLNPNQSFQLMPDNPKRVYLAITAVTSPITLAFGRSIFSSNVALEYSIANTQTLFFESGNAPTTSVNVGTTNTNVAESIQVSILEGSSND